MRARDESQAKRTALANDRRRTRVALDDDDLGFVDIVRSTEHPRRPRAEHDRARCLCDGRHVERVIEMRVAEYDRVGSRYVGLYAATVRLATREHGAPKTRTPA